MIDCYSDDGHCYTCINIESSVMKDSFICDKCLYEHSQTKESIQYTKRKSVVMKTYVNKYIFGCLLQFY